MLKKLTQEKQEEILEAGISEFAEHGLDRTSMSAIAKRAGISVGVLYKYYADKEEFFLACLKRSVNALKEILDELVNKEDKLLHYAEQVIKALQLHAREHGDYIRLYNEVTSGSSRRYAVQLAGEIEGVTAELYTRFIAAAQADGDIRRDADVKLFAFFFDNLLMMLQFSYCCDYYKERFRIYCGEDGDAGDEHVRAELLKFFESAFTLEQADIKHRK